MQKILSYFFILFLISISLDNMLKAQTEIMDSKDLGYFWMDIPKRWKVTKQVEDVGILKLKHDAIIYFCGENAPEYVDHDLQGCRSLYKDTIQTKTGKIAYRFDKDTLEFDMICLNNYLSKRAASIDTINKIVYIVINNMPEQKKTKSNSTFGILVIDLQTKQKIAFYNSSKKVSGATRSKFLQMIKSIRFKPLNKLNSH
jgi:hypothetical protein